MRLRVSIRDGAAEEQAAKALTLRCRSSAQHHSVTFVFVDADDSPQIAAAKFPAAGACGEGNDGCPVLQSTHGMDVTAQRQADCYRTPSPYWVLAPHGRGTHALNWQGSAHAGAERLLSTLARLSGDWRGGAARADPSRLLLTGHSNGGFGALALATLDPDRVLAVAPLAGMLRLGSLPAAAAAQTSVPAPLHQILTAAVSEYDAGPLLSNLEGVPFVARTGSDDNVIHPESSRQLARAAARHGLACPSKQCLDELKGKGHWWWDSISENDGGVMFDAAMRSFFEQARVAPAQLPPTFSFRCANPALCGSRGGVAILQLRTPGHVGSFSVQRDDVWALRTTNVARLRLAGPHLADAHRCIVDGAAIALGGGSVARGVELCRDASGAAWRICDARLEEVETDTGETCSDAEGGGTERRLRGPSTLGPLRRLWEGPVVVVVGTGGGSKADLTRRLDAALRLANEWHLTSGGVVQILRDDELLPAQAMKHNLLLLGGPTNNSWAKRLLEGMRGGMRMSGTHIELGSACRLERRAAVGIVTLMPGHGRGRLAALVDGDATGFENALDAFVGGLFTPNSWTSFAPEYIVTAPAFGWRGWGTGGVLAAGHWGNRWEYVSEASWLESSSCQ